MFTDDDDDDSSDEDYDENAHKLALFFAIPCDKLGQLIYRSMSQSTYNAKFIGTC